MAHSPDESAADGLAALSLCESLLLALGELKILSAKEIDDLLADVAETHRDAADRATGSDAALHRKVAEHTERIRAGGNSGAFRYCKAG
jgi:hypothetical protein